MDQVPLPTAIGADRKRHVWRERNLKEIAALLILFSVNGVASSLLSLLLGLANPAGTGASAITFFLSHTFSVVYGACFLWAGWQLWLLKPLGRLATGGWALGLLYGAYTLVTIKSPAEPTPEGMETMLRYMAMGMAGLAAILLWLTFSKKTRAVLSPDYADAVGTESNRPSILVILVLLLIGVFMAMQLMAQIFGLLTALRL